MGCVYFSLWSKKFASALEVFNVSIIKSNWSSCFQISSLPIPPSVFQTNGSHKATTLAYMADAKEFSIENFLGFVDEVKSCGIFIVMKQ